MADLVNSNNSIGNGLPASVMRESMENKNLLANKGSIYVGTGSNNSIMTGYNVSTTMALEHGAPGTILRYTNDENSPTGFEQIDPATTEDFIANKATNVDLDGEVIQNSSGIFVNVSAGSGSNFSHQIPNASTSGFGVVKLIDSLTDTSTSFALTANKGKVLQDTKASSETTIEGFSLGNVSKTINGLFRYDAGEDGETILDNSNASQALTNLFTNITSADNVVSTIVGPALGFVPDSGLSDFSSNNTTVKIGRNNVTASSAQRIVSIGAEVAGVSSNSVSIGYGEIISSATNSSSFGYMVQNTAPNSVSIGAFSRCFGTAGNGAVAVGYGAYAAGGVSIGKNSSTKQNEDICIGSNDMSTTAQANNGIVIGAGGYANGSGAIAIGRKSTSTNSSVAVGASSGAGNESISIGYSSKANCPGSISIGVSSATNASGSIAIGNNAITHGYSYFGLNTIAIGNYSQMPANNSICIGNNSRGSGSQSRNSIVIGNNSEVFSYETIVIGESSIANGSYGVAVGRNAVAGPNSLAIAIGNASTANGSSSTAVGDYAEATQQSAAAFGAGAKAIGSRSTAISTAVASGYASLAIGEGAGASSSGGIAIGEGAQVYNIYNNTLGGIAIGTEAYNYGNNSITIGTAINQDSDSIAIGNNAYVGASYGDSTGYNSSSIAIGSNVSVNCNNSVAIGSNISVYGGEDVAIGYKSKTLSNGAGGVSIGYNTTSTSQGVAIGGDSYVGTQSVALGVFSCASGVRSAALGPDTQISTNYCIRIGSTSADVYKHLYSIHQIETTSDSRIKNIQGLANTSLCLENVNKLPIKIFSYKDFVGDFYDKNQIGWIADDVECIFPKSVSYSDAEYKNVLPNGSIEKIFIKDEKHINLHSYGVPVLWGAVQELSKLLDQSNEKIAELEQRIATLEAK